MPLLIFFTCKQMILGSYSDPANSTSKYSDLLLGRKCLPGHSLPATLASWSLHVSFLQALIMCRCVNQATENYASYIPHKCTVRKPKCSRAAASLECEITQKRNERILEFTPHLIWTSTALCLSQYTRLQLASLEVQSQLSH